MAQHLHYWVFTQRTAHPPTTKEAEGEGGQGGPGPDAPGSRWSRLSPAGKRGEGGRSPAPERALLRLPSIRPVRASCELPAHLLQPLPAVLPPFSQVTHILQESPATRPSQKPQTEPEHGVCIKQSPK